MSQAEPEQLRHRSIVIRQAVLLTPIAVASAVVAVNALLKVFDGNGGFAIMLVFFGFLAFLFGYQALQYLRDLRAQPVVLEGELTKKWSKGNIFFFLLPSFYISCGRKIFTISKKEYGILLEEDRLRIRHYPHSLTVETLERYDESERGWRPAWSQEDEVERLIAEAERRQRR